MMAKRNAPAGGTAEAMTETAALTGTAISNSNFTLDGAGRQAGKIWNLLPEGEPMAIPANDLAELSGYSSTRALRMAVDGLRSKGVLVLATGNGYFRPSPGPAGITEIRRFLRRQDARAASNRKTTRLIRAQLKELEHGPLPGQTDLWQGGGD